MGIFDRFKSNKAAQGKARDMSDAAERRINEKTGDKYESQVDSGQQQLHERMGMDEDRPENP
ncbi:antitoxin [Streptomyces sp. NBC_00199]|uniref:antitoxin n=1 Tax=Streptomyces sp. NBC_00199 TaxID=2975678 RepID=UPI002253206E|nr:antitoxin [Streptomyces sp. NBC_00199]MCX5265411.1 antitoxin [Streptomyces sp. NBC_00199]